MDNVYPLHRYQGDSSKPEEPVMIFRGQSAISPEHPWFEFTVINTGQRGTISIGLVFEVYDVSKQPGWELGSLGWHADDGK